MRSSDDQLDVLSTTSHRVHDLEVYLAATAGYDRIVALPMRWQGVGSGRLNLFWKPTETRPPVDEVLLQTFEQRSGVDLAEGVLAWQHGFDRVEAYIALLLVAQDQDLTLDEAADTVVAAAGRGEVL